MSYVSEDKIMGFCILSAALGVGSGLIALHFSHDEPFGWGVGLVAGVIGLLVMIFLAKVVAIIDDFPGDDDDEDEHD